MKGILLIIAVLLTMLTAAYATEKVVLGGYSIGTICIEGYKYAYMNTGLLSGGVGLAQVFEAINASQVMPVKCK